MTRSRLLALGAAVLAGDTALRGVGRASAAARGPARLPLAQHAWNASLRRDRHGNPVAPRFHSVLLLDLRHRPTARDAHRLETALRTLESAFRWSPGGLLFVLAWGPSYFERWLGRSSPVEKPTRLSPSESPLLEHYDACLHLACDDELRLSRVEQGLLGVAPLQAAGAPVDLRAVFEVRDVRRGFVGAGLPAAHRGVVGVARGAPIPASAPLFMGFKSGYARNQASEESVTIERGPFAGGTTVHLSRIALSLDDWYGVLDERERVARMFGPQVGPGQVGRFRDDAPSHPGRLDEAARRYGVVGHAQAAGQVRRKGRPLILRRDFDSVDGGRARVHFVSLQRSIGDFVRTRTAMNAGRATVLSPSIGPQINNGIAEWMTVEARANFVVPPRRIRSFPLLSDRNGRRA
jgi:hypothetical protein